jgi:hypothetical protein
LPRSPVPEKPDCASAAPVENCQAEAVMIKKSKKGYTVVSEKKGKNLGGPYKTKAEAEKRLRQVEYFKHNKG